jgi:TetR/AcrR family transcriptional regulator, regulator of cefoperazone and chloramphenicol sensitivity
MTLAVSRLGCPAYPHDEPHLVGEPVADATFHPDGSAHTGRDGNLTEAYPLTELLLHFKHLIDTVVQNKRLKQVFFMVSPVPPPLEAKQRLLEAAEEIFAEKGFTATTIRELAERANVNIAAINYHFGDKERLYIEAVKYAHECSGKHQPQAELPPGTPPVEKLKQFIREITTNMTAPARHSSLQLLMRELNHPTAAAREVVREYIQPVAFTLRGIIQELAPQLPESHRLMIGFSIIGQVLFYRQNRPVSELIFGKDHVDQLSTEQIADHVTQFTLAALGFAPPLLGGSR